MTVNKVKETSSNLCLCRDKAVTIADILMEYGGENPKEIIFGAAARGDLMAVKVLIEEGVPISNPYGENILDSAICSQADNMDLIQYLVEELHLKPAINPFLTILVKSNSWDPSFKKIDYFISKGYSFPDYIVTSFLLQNNNAFQKLDILQNILDRGAKTDCLKMPSSASALLNKIIGTSCKGRYGGTSFYQQWSVQKNWLQFLLSHGINVNVEINPIKDPKPLSSSDGQGASFNSKAFNTPLAIAISHNDVQLVKDLIRYGADVNLPSKQWGLWIYAGHGTEGSKELSQITPLQLAMRLKNKEIVTLLVENGAKIQ